MLRPFLRWVSRFVLAALLITFLSPTFAWQALATHEELQHATATAQSEHALDGDRHDHEDEAHGVMGHVLGHMPVFLSAALTVPASTAVSAICVYVGVEWPRVSPEPPLRPPRFS